MCRGHAHTSHSQIGHTLFTDSPLISRIWRSLLGRVQYSHTAQEHRDLHSARRFNRAYRGF